MSQGNVHIVGAGLAGLAAATELAAQGRAVTLYESSPHAGGRCRSYVDPALGRRIDNGNHLMLSGNSAIIRYLDRIQARETLIELPPTFPFMDLRTGQRWALRLSQGRIPFWIFNPGARVPGSRFWHYLRDLRALQRASGEDAATTVLLRHCQPLGEALWGPLSVSILNTELETGSAKLLWQTFAESLAAGGKACHPLLPREGLSESLVDPAIRRLGASVRCNERLRHIEFEEDCATALDFGHERVALGADDILILAVPSPVATDLVPGLTAPEEFRPIVNAHFVHDLPDRHHSFTGLVGGMAEWVFVKPGILSVTISAASYALDTDADELAAALWDDVRTTLTLGDVPLPAFRIVKEKRATFAATPDQDKRRPETKTRWRNLLLAGDWTQTGLPATIEGAVRSGLRAAELA